MDRLLVYSLVPSNANLGVSRAPHAALTVRVLFSLSCALTGVHDMHRAVDLN